MYFVKFDIKWLNYMQTERDKMNKKIYNCYDCNNVVYIKVI